MTTRLPSHRDPAPVPTEGNYGTEQPDSAASVSAPRASILRRSRARRETRDGVVEVTIPLPKEAKKETIAIAPTAA